MRQRNARVLPLIAATLGLLTSVFAWGHSASDAYLTLNSQQSSGAATAKTVVHGQWDIALRDLDFVLGLDDNGDGRIVWRELQQHQAAIAGYAYRYIHAAAGGKGCAIAPTKQMVDNHADGAYAALFFDIECDGTAKSIALDYRLFFAIDPSHRGILVMRSGDRVATSVLSPTNAKIDLEL